jgi:hypothetical protein
MMQSAHPRKRDDLADLRRLDLPPVGRILAEPEVGPVSVVVVDVPADHATELPLVDRDDVIETVAPEAPDPSLGVAILPWRPQGRADLLEAESFDPLAELGAVD